MKLIPENVPEQLRHLIRLAEEFGISDNGYRWNRVEKATAEEIKSLKDAIHEHDSLFDDWLAGPEADGPEYTNEYIAFSALRMAADEA